MKIKTLLIAGLMMSAFPGSNAYADDCFLSIPSSTWIVLPYIPIPRGQNFVFEVTAPYQLRFGPFPPDPSYVPFTVVFYGTKDGVNDLPNGWQYPYSVNSHDTTTLGGFGNPSDGSRVGFYTRYAKIYDKDGNLYCVTNQVNARLL
jgi:hypothetical protein